MNQLDMMPVVAQGNGINAERVPVVFAREGEAFANSRDVAEFFGKRHDHVIRDIVRLVADGCAPNFGETSREVEMPNGGTRTERSFDMDRRGFTILSMGFTGKRALKWKLRYIDAFEAMEAELSKPRAGILDFSDPNVIAGVIGHLQSEVAKKDEIIAGQAVKVRELDRIAAADGSMCITDAAKTLKVRPIELTNFMSARRWVHKRPGNKSWIAYQDKIQSGFMEHRDHIYVDGQGVERVSTRALVTAKGLVKLAELLNQPLH